jgi:hypothetical protein
VDIETFPVGGQRQFIGVFRQGDDSYALTSVTGYHRFFQECERQSGAGLRVVDAKLQPHRVLAGSHPVPLHRVRELLRDRREGGRADLDAVGALRLVVVPHDSAPPAGVGPEALAPSSPYA